MLAIVATQGGSADEGGDENMFDCAVLNNIL
jgi:hypothetical protein